MNSSQEILDIIMQYISKSGMTEKECLISCQINTSFLTDWKKGKIKYPSYDKIIKLAIYLNIDIGWIFTGEKKSSVLSKDEQELLNYYKVLPDSEKNKLLGRASALAEIYGNADQQTEQKPRMAHIAAYGQGTMDIPAAAPLTEEELKHFFPDEK